MSKNFFQALAAMVGYIIGVGMFGLPYLFIKAGIWPCLVLVAVIGTAQYFIHLLYAAVICDNPGYHRLPGHANNYFGPAGKHLTLAVTMIGNYGAMLAYIIVGGVFAHQLFSPAWGGSEVFYASILFFIAAAVVFFGIKTIARFEFYLTAALVIIMALVIKRSLEFADPANLTLVNWKYALLPFGAILFAFDGGGVIPLAAEILNKKRKSLKTAISLGTFFSIALIIIFSLITAAVTGGETTPDALKGLWNVMDGKIVLISLILGLLVIATSFFAVAENIKDTFCRDYGMGKKISWALAFFIPYAFYLAGFNNFIGVISFVGAISGGFTGIILILIFRKMEKEKKKLSFFRHKPGRLFLGMIFSLFMAGIIYEVWNFLL
ncbi:MAG: aromatic amino acid transport family protein [Patescibacteria group bacterium]|jgi:amino acid permease